MGKEKENNVGQKRKIDIEKIKELGEYKPNTRVERVLVDMEYIEFHCDMRYCNWEECKQQVRQSILSHIPKNSQKAKF